MNSIATLIDADTLIFFIAYQAMNEQDADKVLEETDKFVNLILDKTNATYYLGFIGGTKCFRYEVAKHLPYKGNRPSKPEWFTRWEPVIRYRLTDHWKFIISDGIEAEDAVCICNEHYKDYTNIVIAHVDKDLDDIEGNHYNYKNHKHYYSDYLGNLVLNDKKKLKGTGRKWFWSQMIIGDKPTDNIEGLKGKGDVFAYTTLKDCTTEYSMMRRVYLLYIKQHGLDYGRTLFIETLQLIGMLNKPAYGFKIPQLINRYQAINEDQLKELFD
jgi:hypothetical protein